MSNTEKFPGCFISLEGPDGSGKTTNVDYLAEQVRQLGYEVVLTREPGGSDVGELIRTLVLNNRVPPMAELLLMFAARADHVEELIKPALRAGKVVISDRFVDSTYAYQGQGRDLRDEVVALERLVLKGFMPDWTLYFDVGLDESLRRLKARTDKQDRFDQEELAFRQAVWVGYKYRFNTDETGRMFRVDAEKTLEGVRNQIQHWVRHCFQGWMLNKARS